MDKNLLNEMNEKLNLVLSLFTIKENGKMKTILEKYNETKKETKSTDDEMMSRYKHNKKHSGYHDVLRKIMEESFEISGAPPKTDSKGFFIYEEKIYNIEDYQQ